MSQSNYVHLEDCEIKKVTDRAVLICHDDEDHWIPVSQLADGDGHDHEQGDIGVTVSITEWIAREKGIEA